MTTPDEITPSKPSKAELLGMLDDMLASIERLPPHAMITPISHYDYSALLILLSALFKAADD